MKKCILLFFSITIGFNTFVFAGNLYELSDKEKVKVAAKWNDGIELSVQNTSGTVLNVDVQTGTSFRCGEEEDQNQVFFGLETIALQKGESKTVLLKTYCMEASDGWPSSDVVFTLMKHNNDKLQQLADFAYKEKFEKSSTMQSAVWCVTDERSISNIYGLSPDRNILLVEFLSKLTGQEVPKRIPKIKHNINWVKGIMNYNASKTMEVSFGIYDSTGSEITNLMPRTRIIPGYHTFKFRYNEAAPDNKIYLVQLRDREGKVIKEARVVGDEEVKETFETLESRFTYNWNLTKGNKGCKLAVYDQEGNIRQTIFDKRYLPAGRQAMKYTFRHNDGPDARFFVRLTSGDKQLGELEIPAETPELKKDFPEQTLTIREVINVRSKVPSASCFIYDAEDTQIATVFKGKKLKSGVNKINYDLQHTYGPDASFKMVVRIDGGRKLLEKLIP